MVPRRLHVVPSVDGGWDVKVDGDVTPLAHHEHRRRAIRAARLLAREHGLEVRIHDHAPSVRPYADRPRTKWVPRRRG